jgi:hypothetical protein
MTMIVNDLDLDIAVAEGVISRDQAAQLRDLSVRDKVMDDSTIDFSQDTRDEPFRLLRGFRDFFIAIGVVIFAVGLSSFLYSFVGKFGATQGDMAKAAAQSLSFLVISFGLCIFGVVQAEIITRRQRLPFSSLVVSIALAVWSAFLFGAAALLMFSDKTTSAGLGGWQIAAWGGATGALLSVIFFYWRYRLPFSLLLLAASIVALSFLLATEIWGPVWFVDYGRLLIGFWGVMIFLGAMWFDVKDRLRVTRLSECAFWLHLFAAPLLVHALLFGNSREEPDAALILGMMGVMSVIALLIDRRALLVSGLSYFTVAIGHLVSGSSVLGFQSFALTAFILGGFMLVLGLGWTPIRRGVLALLPFDAVKARLPPAMV